jgi:rhomboid protease GluP
MFFSYQKTVALGELSPEQFIMLAAVSMDDLHWDHYTPDNTRLYARAHMGILSWGEFISVTIEGQEATLSSRQPMWKFLIPRRSEENIQSLIEYMDHNRQIHTPASLEQQYEEQLQNREATMQPTEKIIMAPDLPMATAIIVALTSICFFGIGLLRGSFSEISVMELFRWGGNIRLHTLGGEGWRLITACFLHISFWHLLGNMFVLFFIGRLLEPVIGPYVLTIGYLCTGIIGSLASVLVAGNRISAGASGSIFGLFGIFLAILTTPLLTGETKRVLFKGLFLLMAYGLYEGMHGAVDNAAHVGGLLSGFVFGYIIYTGHRSVGRMAIATTIVVLVTTGATAFALKYYHLDTVAYERMLQRMYSLEMKVRSAKKNSEDRPEAEKLLLYKDTVAPAWKEYISIADSAENFRFGSNNMYHDQHRLLKRFGQLKQQENDAKIESLERGVNTVEKQDSVRILLKKVGDSLITVYSRPR